jgi:hypothetical protein
MQYSLYILFLGRWTGKTDEEAKAVAEAAAKAAGSIKKI